MEPKSSFYHDPVLVLDFQSLYPSMMIAYNLCFSTCLGELPSAPPAPAPAFGCLPRAPTTTHDLASISPRNINIAPIDRSRGVLFVRPEVRRGVLPAMLAEILETRKMVKVREKKERKKEVAFVENKTTHRRE
jgi:DNA polymerase zeta